MKKIIFYSAIHFWLMAMLTTTSIQASPTVYEQLCQLNSYWHNNPSTDPYLQQMMTFSDHEKLIRLHLMTIENTLKNRDVSHLNAQQRANRANCLTILNQYWQAGLFPKNTNHTTTIPYFIDVNNTACAVGHLIRETGYEELACRIANEMNNAYIFQMPYAEIPQWADKMGFTLNELKWIQPAYTPPLTITTQNTDATCSNNNGNITATVQENWVGGSEVTPENVRWYNINNNTISLIGHTQNLNNVRAGLYKIRINGGTGMFPFIDKHIAISDADAPQITATIQNETCPNSLDGRIEIAITGGAAPYNIVWYNQNGAVVGNGTILNNLQGWQYLIGMYEGEAPAYIAEVTDNNGCKRFGTYQIDTDNPESPYAWGNATHPSCGSNNGSITLEYVTPNTTIAWAHDPNLNSAIATNLAVGHYEFTVTNNISGCSYQSHVDLYNQTAFPANFASNFVVEQTYCNQNAGAIQCPQGFSYQWQHDPNLTNSRAENLSEGYYSVILTNSSGCQFLYTTYISNYLSVYINSDVQLTNANSQTGQLGSIVLGTDIMEYTYAWSHDANLSNSSAENLSVGNYSVTITGLNGCTLTQSFAILDESQFTSSISNPSTSINLYFAQVAQDLRINYNTSIALQNAQISLYDLNGRKVAAQTMESEQTILPIAHLPLGVYILELSSNNMHKSQKILLH